MQAMEEVFQKATEDGTIPGAILLAETSNNSFKYAKAFGVRSLQTKEPMTLSTAMAIASCTKLLTTISILQLFQSGKLKPETDALLHLPELAKQPVLTGFDSEGKPQLTERKGGITVRHLLTHTFGGTYLFLSPRIMQYYADGVPPDATIPERAGIPLIAEPGEEWSYSHGLDWAGLLLERITGTDLDSYMRDHLWKPLGISDDEIGFWPEKHAGLKARKAALAMRDDPGGSVRYDKKDVLNRGSTAAFGGHGLFATLPAYMKILRSIADRNDERLLSKHWKAEMFKPQIGQRSEDRLNAILNDPVEAAAFIGEIPAHRVRYSWSYGGLLSLNADEGWRGKGTLLWSGYFNLLWYVDPEAGLCLLYGSQVAPPGDIKIKALITKFEKSVYGQLNGNKGRL